MLDMNNLPEISKYHRRVLFRIDEHGLRESINHDERHDIDYEATAEVSNMYCMQPSPPQPRYRERA